MTDESDEPPVLRVVRGDPTPEELAALVAVLLSRRAAAPEGVETAMSVGAWADHRHALRRPLAVGAGAWRTSGRQAGLRTRADW